MYKRLGRFSIYVGLHNAWLRIRNRAGEPSGFFSHIGREGGTP